MLPNTDNAEKNTASHDELNPLSNPLLAANMGRWAEVYFTTRPEHRDKAVADLLRGLEIEAAEKHEDQGGGNRTAILNQHPPAPNPPRTLQPLPANPFISCTTCGHDNSSDHSFCGMCGAPLLSTTEADDTEAARSAALPPEHAPLSSYCIDDGNEPRGRSDIAEEHDATSSPGATHMDDSDLPHFARLPEPVAYRYRLYLGVVLAILLGGLIYVAKRGNPFSDGQLSPDARVMPTAQPASNPPAAQNPSNSPLPVAEVENNENPPHPPPEAQPQPRGISPDEATSPLPAPRSAMAPANSPTASAQRVAVAGQSGTADLAAAEKYLGGNQGSAHDPRGALPLLWDAVAKGNGSATLVLSDLYLRGEGVAQNCDQARLLLDLAAKKGVKGAGERLRHLPAFGCR